MSYRTLDDAVADRERIFKRIPWNDACNGEDWCHSTRHTHIIVDGQTLRIGEYCSRFGWFQSRISFYTIGDESTKVAEFRPENLYHRLSCRGGITYRRNPSAPPMAPEAQQDLRRNPVECFDYWIEGQKPWPSARVRFFSLLGVLTALAIIIIGASMMLGWWPFR
jgi:hypothetical protein